MGTVGIRQSDTEYNKAIDYLDEELQHAGWTSVICLLINQHSKVSFIIEEIHQKF